MEAVGSQLSSIKPGSEAAAKVKAVLQAKGYWSQYLEVGIGPDAEVFTKAPPMSAVGCGAMVGINPISTWNNPEPEVVLAVDSKGRIKGATLGNDVNLRDVEGRSALLLGEAKDNNGACAVGPFIRLFDAHFSMADVEKMEVRLTVKGDDGYLLDGTNDMSRISRRPEDLVKQTINSIRTEYCCSSVRCSHRSRIVRLPDWASHIISKMRFAFRPRNWERL